jgi:hypothetical protein
MLAASLWTQQAPARSGFKIEPMPMPLNRPVNADDHLHMLTEQLNLSPAQQNKIRPVLEKYIKQRHAILMSKSLSPDAKSKQLKTAEDAAHLRTRVFLNAEQKKKFDDLMGISEPPPDVHRRRATQAKNPSGHK